jgi:hypothetical protein
LLGPEKIGSKPQVFRNLPESPTLVVFSIYFA